MCHLYPRTLSAAAALAILWTGVAASSSQIAARIDGEEISIAAVDALSSEAAQQLRSRLMEVTHQAVQELIDRRLGIPAATLPHERARIYRAHQVRFVLPVAQALETALPPEQVIAFVGKDAIAAAAVEEAAALRLYRLRGELYLQRRRDLNLAIEARLLQAEAQRRGVSLQELEKSLASTEAVTEAEVAEFVASERAAGRVVENPERVRPYLAFQKGYQQRTSLLEAIRARTQIHIDLRPPTRPILPMETDAGLAFGAPSGPLLVVYTNYHCPVCRATHLELDRLLNDSEPPRIVLRDFAHDSSSMEAAALVRCAAKMARAADVRLFLLRTDPPALGKTWFDAKQLQAVAHFAGMTPSALRTCSDSPEIQARIEHDTQAAHRLGFDDPPAFVAAGVPLSGMQTAQRLRDALNGVADSELSVR
jgi:protein-disulfide isomerase